MLQYNKTNLNSLIALENSLAGLSRGSWEDKFIVNINEALDYDVCIRDDKGNRIILFHNLLKDSSYRMTLSMQLLRHWLLGKKLSTELQEQVIIGTLNVTAINLFFTGTKNDIIKYQEEEVCLPLESNNELKFEPSLDWNVLHFPAHLIINNSEIEDIKNLYLPPHEKGKYEIRVAYGIVSKTSHVKSDKQKIIEITEKFLNKNNFDSHKRIESKDIDRNGEPIVLWMCKSKYKDADFYPLLGVNFGYDNGLSGYRLGFGIYFEDEQTGFYNFSRNMFQSFDMEINVEPIFKTWIHHKNFGKIEETFENFLNNGYEMIFNNIVRIIDHAKSFHYSDYDASVRVMLSYHRTKFAAYANNLTESHKKLSKKHGNNHYTHFLCWSYIADNVLSNNDEVKLANLISRNILILKK